MVTRSLTILTIIFWSCTSKQRQANITTTDTLAKITRVPVKHQTFTTRNCYLDSLSNQFDVRMIFNRYSDTAEHDDAGILKVLILNKQSKEVMDSLSLASSFYFSRTFEGCNNAISYTTSFNSGRQIIDNYPGDVVVADLNFDNKDDIALVDYISASSGPLYDYYIQDSAKKFKREDYLTDSVSFFPTIIDKKKLRLTSYVHAGVCCTGEDVYQYDKPTRRWKHIKHKLHRD